MKSYFSCAIIALALLPSCFEKKNMRTVTKKADIPAADEALDIIVESNHFSSIFHYLKPQDLHKNTLVVLDIDNTIARTPTDLGSDQWFYAMSKRLTAEKGMAEQDAMNMILPTVYHIQKNTHLVPVEPDTVSIINQLHDHGVTVIGLTARSLGIHQRTVEQLKALGIHFSNTTPHQFYMKDCDGQPGLFCDGIIFSGHCDKGELLNEWLTTIGYHPKKVIFVDDKMKNIHSVERALHQRNYPFIGIRYGYTDERVKSLDLDTMESEFQEFMQKYPPPPATLSSLHG
jgi:FMN phosphatase YigB (HAD superfamily)